MTGRIPLAIGNHGVIEQDRESRLVSKQFSPSERHLAGLEFDYLTRLSGIFAEHRFISCPEPSSVERERGTVWMSYCEGRRLDHLILECPETIEPDIEHLAIQIALAVELYVGEFGEPYYDVATKHVLYDLDSRILSLVDFSGQRRFAQFAPEESPIEISLGILLGRTIYDSVRPERLRRRHYWRILSPLLATVTARVSDGKDLKMRLVRRVAWNEFSFRGDTGTIRRRLWYSTLARFLFHRRLRGVLRRRHHDRARR